MYMLRILLIKTFLETMTYFQLDMHVSMTMEARTRISSKYGAMKTIFVLIFQQLLSMHSYRDEAWYIN